MDEQKDSPNASKTKPEMFAIWGWHPVAATQTLYKNTNKSTAFEL